MFLSKPGMPMLDTDETAGQEAPVLTEEDVKREAQKIADAIVARKLKDMPSKEEMTAFKAWAAEQKKKDEEPPELKEWREKATQAEQKAKEMEAKATKYERERLALSKGVTADFVEFVAHKVGGMVTEDKSFDELLDTYLEANPIYKGSMKTGMEHTGQAGDKMDGVEKAFYARNPHLKKE